MSEQEIKVWIREPGASWIAAPREHKTSPYRFPLCICTQEERQEFELHEAFDILRKTCSIGIFEIVDVVDGSTIGRFHISRSKSEQRVESARRLLARQRRIA